MSTYSDLKVFSPESSSKIFEPSDGEAWTRGDCPRCGSGVQLAVIARTAQYGQVWLRCPSCSIGIVSNHGVVSPSTTPLREPAGLPEDVAEVWNEARRCLAVKAHTAAVMVCRKILFHMAVGNGLPAKNDRDRAPGFLECVNSLEAAGVMTAAMRPWVDRIKDVGNDANHELAPVSAGQAMDVATFTQQLLVLGYEMHALSGT